MFKGEYTDLELCYRGEDDKDVETCSNKHGTIGHMSEVSQTCNVYDFKTMLMNFSDFTHLHF